MTSDQKIQNRLVVFLPSFWTLEIPRCNAEQMSQKQRQSDRVSDIPCQWQYLHLPLKGAGSYVQCAGYWFFWIKSHTFLLRIAHEVGFMNSPWGSFSCFCNFTHLHKRQRIQAEISRRTASERLDSSPPQAGGSSAILKKPLSSQFRTCCQWFKDGFACAPKKSGHTKFYRILDVLKFLQSDFRKMQRLKKRPPGFMWDPSVQSMVSHGKAGQDNNWNHFGQKEPSIWSSHTLNSH